MDVFDCFLIKHFQFICKPIKTLDVPVLFLIQCIALSRVVLLNKLYFFVSKLKID